MTENESRALSGVNFNVDCLSQIIITFKKERIKKDEFIEVFALELVNLSDAFRAYVEKFVK